MVHKQENSSPRPSQTLYFTFIALLFLVFPSSNAFWGSSEDSLWQEAEDTFLAELQGLEGKFSMQTEETWLQLTSTIANTLKAKPPQHPAVITALLPPDLDISFSTCFLSFIGLAVNKAIAPVLKGRKQAAPLIITSQSFDKQSITNIRQNIETYFKTEGKALLVLDIQNFTNSDNLQVFHGLCDNYNSVDPRATILFPVRVPQHIYEKYRPWRHNMGGAISNEVLTEAWENVVNKNTGPALIARVADAVILLNGGDTCKEIQIEENEEFIDNTISGDSSPKEVSDPLQMQLSKIAANVQKLEKVVAANHIDNKNDFLAIMKETKKLQDRILDIEFKLDAFIIIERQAHESERLDFHKFKFTTYFVLGFLAFIQLVILWKVFNLTNIIHSILQRFLSAADVSSDAVQNKEKKITKIPKGTEDLNSPYSSDEDEPKKQEVGNARKRK